MSLTLQRIFGDPDLNGPAPLQLKLSPDGKFVSYLKAPEDNFEQLDLWVYNIESGCREGTTGATPNYPVGYCGVLLVSGGRFDPLSN